MKKIIIYTGNFCGHCDWAKALLDKKKVNFTEINIHNDPSKREEMMNKSSGARTVPQIFIGDHHVGGNRELQTLEREGKLNTLLEI
tara:strand:- start:1384 stop:1641 length:258 start_codon:yes stop_codon:yes gene_type:complete